MKQILITLCLLFGLFISGFSQEAMFETAFYFEDGVGNKDTIYLKLDPSIETWGACTACDEIVIQEEYGEDYLTTPFDSEFEVRAAFKGDYQNVWQHLTEPNSYKLQKTVVMKTVTDAPYFPDCYLKGIGLTFLMRIKHLPIKVTYDPEFFNSDCNRYHYFTNTYYFQTLDCKPENLIDCFQNPPEEEFFACTDDGYFEYYFDKKYGDDAIEAIDEIALLSDGTTDTLEFLQINHGFLPLTPCPNVTQTIIQETANNLAVYPNPTSNRLTIELDVQQATTLSFFGATGQSVQSITLQRGLSIQEIDISHLDTGIYFYTVINSNNDQLGKGKVFVIR